MSKRLEDTSKRLRISVHVYASGQEKVIVIEEAFSTYLKAKTVVATDNKIPLALVDNK